MRKLIIQVPCYNEAQTLPITLRELPRSLPGVDRVEWLVVDDGSTDRTVEVAKANGVDHVVTLPSHQGLAKAFMAGLHRCLEAGADVIVNLDADNQYCAEEIPKLIQPILAGQAEIVIGARPINQIAHFSMTKKRLQRIGSWVVRKASRTDTPDATSGFRAISRQAAMRLNVFNAYTYTLEMTIQAGQQGMAVVSVPIRTNADLRPSRLVQTIPSYVRQSAGIILRTFMTYQPLRFFLWLGSIPFTVGVVLCVRWLVLFLSGTPKAHVPSLVAASICIFIGFQLWVFGLVAHLLAVNRKILEDIQLRTRLNGITDHHASNV